MPLAFITRENVLTLIRALIAVFRSLYGKKDNSTDLAILPLQEHTTWTHADLRKHSVQTREASRRLLR